MICNLKFPLVFSSSVHCLSWLCFDWDWGLWVTHRSTVLFGDDDDAGDLLALRDHYRFRMRREQERQSEDDKTIIMMKFVLYFHSKNIHSRQYRFDCG